MAACATAPEEAPVAAEAPAAAEREDRLGDLIASLPAGAPAGPEADSFVGEPISALEDLLGAPALVRQEGAYEFRRYDLGECRAYAVVQRRPGTILKVSTGPAVAGNAAPAFPDCTAGLTSVGT